jgi:ribonucleotide reductase alpha subunit
MLHRHFTSDGMMIDDVLDLVDYEKRSCRIRTDDGRQVFETEAEVPAFWSQTAGDIAVSKYLRKADAPALASGKETSVRQLIWRVARKISLHGQENGTLTPSDAIIFEAELAHMLVHQMVAFNSPVWFNVGLDLYGSRGHKGNHRYTPEAGLHEVNDSCVHPQASACFILKPGDSLDEIYRQLTEEMKVFRNGSGAGYNLSVIREFGAPLGKGGTSSGVMSFAKVLDASAGAIKSGGTTRRSARMVILDMDHPDIEVFIDWKVKEEKKAQALISAGYPADFNGEVYQTIGGQNANNSVSITDEFMQAVDADAVWPLRSRTSGEVVKEVRARDLWRKIAESAWFCADPGIQFRTTINSWNCVPAMGEIEATNPCCFTAEMLVDTSEGLLSFAALEEMSSQGKELPLAYAFDKESRLPVLRPIKRAWVAGLAKKLVTVTTERGLVLRCTPEHRFLLRNGEYVEAQHLTPGTSLRKISRGINTARSNRRYIYRRVTADSPSDTIVQARFLWEQARGPIPDGFDIHHRNDDPTDDRLSNLELIDGQVHAVEHSTGENNPRYLGVDPLTLVEVWGLIEDKINADKARWAATYQRITELRAQGLNYARIAAVLDNEGYRPERSDAWSSSKVSAIISQGYMGRKDPKVTHMRWNSTVEALGLKGIVPMANIEGVQGKSWEEFAAHIDKLKADTNDRVASVVHHTADEYVYDIEVEGVHNFGVTMPGATCPHTIVVSNSEYVFPSNSACNLASINLVAFYTTAFSAQGFDSAVRVMITAMEILVGLASYPTGPIAENSYKYRPLGLGFANLGALLMRLGVPYDSVDGRSIAAALSSRLTAVAYHQSAVIAASLGAFEGFKPNRASMLAVLDRHRIASAGVPDNRWIPRPSPLWDAALELALEHGLRNAQVSLMAPTGTISFMMDCDTTGIEPGFSLVAYKKLSGGGNLTIVNQAVTAGLKSLGYEAEQITRIVERIGGTRWADSVPVLASIMNPGELKKLNELLPLASSLTGVLNEKNFPEFFKRVGGEEGLAMELLTSAQMTLTPCKTLGALEDILIGVGGIPVGELPNEHLEVFDCAVPCGKYGTRSLSPRSHVLMMAAIQPHISGAISKTVNLPNSATVEDIEDVHRLAWNLGLKSIAVYRDGCKQSQPLNTSKKEEKKVSDTIPAPSIHPARVRLPAKVGGYRQKVEIGGMDVYLHIGLFDDGQPAELFVTVGKEGGTLRGLLDSLSTMVSIMLQYGVPLETIVDKLLHTNFEPAGPVQGDPRIKLSSSVLDYIARHLGVNYLHRENLAHVEVSTPDSWPAEAATNPSPSRASKKPAPSHTGQMCSSCGGLTTQSGTCRVCTVCGVTTGCG